jgi:hypothetical protein
LATVAFQVAWDEEELTQGHVLAFGVVGPVGDQIAEVRSTVVPMRPPGAHPGPIRTNGVVPIAFVVQEFGEHHVEVAVDKVRLSSLSLRVIGA